MEWEDIAVNVLGTLIGAAILGLIGWLWWRARSSEPAARIRVYMDAMCEELRIDFWNLPHRCKLRRLFRQSEVQEAIHDPACRVEDKWRVISRKAEEFGLWDASPSLFAFYKKVRTRMWNTSNLKEDALMIAQQTEHDSQETGQLYRSSQQLVQKTRDPLQKVESLCALGSIALGRGEYGEAESRYQDALDIAESLSDTELQRQIRTDVGYLRFEQGELARRQQNNEEAERRYQEALGMADEVSDTDLRRKALTGISYLRADQGAAAQGRGEHGEAERLHQEALSIAEQVGDRELRDQVRRHIGYLRDAEGEEARKRGEYEQAERLYLEGLKIAEELGNVAQSLRAQIHTHLGLLYAAQHRLEEAREYLTAAMSLESVETAMKLTDHEEVRMNERLCAELKWHLVPRAEKVRREYSKLLLTEAAEIFERLGDERARQVRAELDQIR